MKDLKDKVAVITGGASGIGLAMAEAFGAEGMKLVIADIEQSALDGAVAMLSGKGFDVLGVRTDVSKFADVERLAAVTLRTFGKIHLAVNNAGVSITGPIWEMSLDDWRWVQDVNFWGVVHGIKVFTPILLEQGEEGHMIITASEAGFLGIGYHSVYCATKAAIISLGASLYSELTAADSGIGVSVVCCGVVDTQIHRAWRNRPEGDHSWSTKERDPVQQARSDAYQRRGAPAHEVAQATVDAVKQNRFYVFNTPHWQDLIRSVGATVLSGQNPPVHTWGPDLRSEKTEPRAAGEPSGYPPSMDD